MRLTRRALLSVVGRGSAADRRSWAGHLLGRVQRGGGDRRGRAGGERKIGGLGWAGAGRKRKKRGWWAGGEEKKRRRRLGLTGPDWGFPFLFSFYFFSKSFSNLLEFKPNFNSNFVHSNK